MEPDALARLGEVIESIPDGFIAVDRDWRIELINGRAERLAGCERASVIGRVYWDAYPNLIGSEFEAPIRRAMVDRRAATVEQFYVPKQGWFELDVRPLACGGLAFYGRDTTARRLLARERDQLLGRLRQQFERMPVACLVTDRDWKLIDWNPAAERVFGYTRGEVLGKDGIAMLVPPAARAAVLDIVRRMIDGDVTPCGINDNITKSGRIITCEWHNTPLRDHDGQVTGFLGMAEDITARKDAEDRLRRSESLLAEAQRIARFGSWNWDLVTDKVTWSDEVYRLFGLEPDGSASRALVRRHVHPEDLDRILQRLDQVRRNPHAFEISWRIVRANGEVRLVHMLTQAEVDGSGAAIRLFGTMQDVTEREALLASERRAREDAERAARMRDDFLATLSHELRTPLTAIISWADVVRTSPTPARIERALEIIARNARTQAQLVGDLLDLSRIVTGKLRLDIQRVSLPDAVAAAVDMLRPTAEARGIGLQLVMEPFTDLVHGDASRLQQVVWNLIANALKFTERGGHVQVVVARVNSHLEVSVSDDGRGIDPTFLPHVFGQFRQADTSTAREHGGLGIGLALVKELVELHGGTVSAHSGGLGKGATFVVQLPIALLTTATGEVRLHPRVPAALSLLDLSVPRLTGMRILVVDDDPDCLEVMRQLLADQDAVVTGVGSVDEALDVLDNQTFHVLLSDIGMPRRDGYELITEVRRRGLKIPAAAVTAFARSEDRTRALVSGFQAHIAKPVEAAELIATVASLSGRLTP